MRQPECAAGVLQLLEMMGLGDWRVMVVAGESGAGKTSLAISIAEVVQATLLSQDGYFRLAPPENHAARLLDLTRVGPDEVDLERFASDVERLRAGECVTPPLLETAVEPAGERIIVEGTYLMGFAPADVRVFIDRTFAETEADRRKRGRDKMEPFVERVLALEQPFVREHLPLANVIVNKAFVPRAHRGARAPRH